MAKKKINITKNDTAETAVIKLLKAKEKEITLTVPNFSTLARSIDNFQLLKREAEEAGKTIIIESVDDTAVELARRSDLEASNPFFLDKKNIKALESDEEKPVIIDDVSLSDIKDDIGPSHHNRFGFWIAFVSFSLILLPGFYLAYKVLPRANVKLTTQKIEWDYNATLMVDKVITSVDLTLSKIPGRVFSQKKNGQFTFPATGTKRVNKKASGSVTIYNNYSSAPQPLIASTRLETPDGKIFRLVDSITVPGSPSSIVVKVMADRGGEEYNIGPITRFTIPGLKQTPKFNGFYAASSEAMKGGFIGETVYPTEADIVQAKEKSVKILKEGLNMLIQNEISKDFKIVEGSSKFNLLKQVVNNDINEKNEFSIFSEVEASFMAFRESDIMAILDENIKKELNPSLKPKTFSLVYGEPKIDLIKEVMNLPVTFKGQLEYPVNQDKLKEQLVGKSELELKAMLFAMPGLMSAKVSFWPFWVNRVPEKVDFVVE